MTTGWVPGSAAIIADALAAMFGEHGVESVRDGDDLVFPTHNGMRINGEAYRQYPAALQLDMRLTLGDGRLLCESVGGIHTDDTAAIHDGLPAFQRATLPVLLEAFFDRPRLVDRLRWTIGGTKRIVFVGQITTRFGFPRTAEDKPDIGFFFHFKKLLEAWPLPAGTHWIRVYHARMKEKVLSNEVLLDNDVWPEMQDAMAAFDWPPTGNKTYDVRVFVVIRDG